MTRAPRTWRSPHSPRSRRTSSTIEFPPDTSGSVARPLGAGDEHHGGSVGDQAAVEEVQRLDDEPGCLVVLERQRRSHDGGRIERGVLAKRNRDGAELGARRAVEREVALGRERRSRRGRGQPVHGVLFVGAAFLARALEVARPAQQAALLDEADAAHTGHAARQPRRHGHGRVLQRGPDEASVRPALVGEPDAQAERLGKAIVVESERPADVDDETIHLVAADAAVGERALERLRSEPHGRVGRPLREAAGADADDGGAVADRHHVSKSRSFTFCTLPVAVTGSSARLAKRKTCGTLKAASRSRQKARSVSADTSRPSFSTTTAARISSRRGSGTPITYTCSTSG